MNIDKVAAAIAADAGQEISGLEDSLREMQLLCATGSKPPGGVFCLLRLLGKRPEIVVDLTNLDT